MKPEYVLPDEIEKRSFEIISDELGDIKILDEIRPILMRVIHTTADFDYLENLKFSENAVKTALDAIKKGVVSYSRLHLFYWTCDIKIYSSVITTSCI